jgi:hypothetical protein
LITKVRLRRIILCDGLAFQGQRRTALPDFEHDDLYFDVDYGKHDKVYMRKVIHHEFFHIIDYKNGTLYKDERWARLAPKGFKYGTGGKNAQDDPFGSLLKNDLPGVLTKYSMSGVEEDKAEVFANMVVSYGLVEERMKKDAVIKAKAEHMTDFLKTFVPKMDSSFWDKAKKLERSKQTSSRAGGAPRVISFLSPRTPARSARCLLS